MENKVIMPAQKKLIHLLNAYYLEVFKYIIPANMVLEQKNDCWCLVAPKKETTFIHDEIQNIHVYSSRSVDELLKDQELIITKTDNAIKLDILSDVVKSSSKSNETLLYSLELPSDLSVINIDTEIKCNLKNVDDTHYRLHGLLKIIDHHLFQLGIENCQICICRDNNTLCRALMHKGSIINGKPKTIKEKMITLLNERYLAHTMFYIPFRAEIYQPKNRSLRALSVDQFNWAFVAPRKYKNLDFYHKLAYQCIGSQDTMSNLVKNKFLLADDGRGGIGFSDYYEGTAYRHGSLVTALYQLQQLDDNIVRCELEKNVEVLGVFDYVSKHIKDVNLECKSICFQRNNALIANAIY